MEENVDVYSFYVAEGGKRETSVLSTFKATRDAIGGIAGATVAEGTSMRVQASDLDEFGRFFWRPTGWGDLN